MEAKYEGSRGAWPIIVQGVSGLNGSACVQRLGKMGLTVFAVVAAVRAVVAPIRFVSAQPLAFGVRALGAKVVGAVGVWDASAGCDGRVVCGDAADGLKSVVEQLVWTRVPRWRSLCKPA